MRLIDADAPHNQTAKQDVGKPRLSLVPSQIIWDIAQVREYGNAKYHDPENWRIVETERYIDALYRHFLHFLDNPTGTDEESGIEHYKHMACNMAFICEMINKPLEKCPAEDKSDITLWVDFFKKHPNAPRDSKGMPKICPRYCGYMSPDTPCPLDANGSFDCAACWDAPFNNHS